MTRDQKRIQYLESKVATLDKRTLELKKALLDLASLCVNTCKKIDLLKLEDNKN